MREPRREPCPKKSSTRISIIRAFACLAKRAEYQRAVLVVNQRNVTSKLKNIQPIMANLNLGQDVANKSETKSIAAHLVAKSYPL